MGLRDGLDLGRGHFERGGDAFFNGALEGLGRLAQLLFARLFLALFRLAARALLCAAALFFFARFASRVGLGERAIERLLLGATLFVEALDLAIGRRSKRRKQ